MYFIHLMVMYEIIVFPKMRIFKDISKLKYIVKLLFLLLSQCGKGKLKLKSRLFTFTTFSLLPELKQFSISPEKSKSLYSLSNSKFF